MVFPFSQIHALPASRSFGERFKRKADGWQSRGPNTSPSPSEAVDGGAVDRDFACIARILEKGALAPGKKSTRSGVS
jgi:hypothetical protein